MSTELSTLLQGIKDGSVVPYIEFEALSGSTNVETGESIPADSDSLIIAMNNGSPMAPKLMH